MFLILIFYFIIFTIHIKLKKMSYEPGYYTPDGRYVPSDAERTEDAYWDAEAEREAELDAEYEARLEAEYLAREEREAQLEAEYIAREERLEAEYIARLAVLDAVLDAELEAALEAALEEQRQEEYAQYAEAAYDAFLAAQYAGFVPPNQYGESHEHARG